MQLCSTCLLCLLPCCNCCLASRMGWRGGSGPKTGTRRTSLSRVLLSGTKTHETHTQQVRLATCESTCDCRVGTAQMPSQGTGEASPGGRSPVGLLRGTEQQLTPSHRDHVTRTWETVRARRRLVAPTARGANRGSPGDPHSLALHLASCRLLIHAEGTAQVQSPEPWAC